MPSSICSQYEEHRKLKNITIIIAISECVYVCEYTCIALDAIHCVGQAGLTLGLNECATKPGNEKTTFRSQFSPSTMVLGLNSGCQVCVAFAFTQ